MKYYILLMQLFLTSIVLSQQVDSLIQIHPGIGDTLTLFDRTYFGLFPEIKDFDYAIFYIRNDETLVAKILSSPNDTTKETIQLQNLSSLDSINRIIREIATFNYQLRNELKDIYLETKNGNWIEGQLEMFDSEYIYIYSSNVTADHIGRMRYRIPVSDIHQLTIEGSSNLVLGMCIGGAAGGAIGLLAYSAIRKEQSDNSFKNCTANFNNAANATAALVGITLGGFLIGTLVGASSSTDDNVFFFDTDLDVLKLREHSFYVLNKEILNEQKYYDIY
jgi:small nuclear ribonucleoprotein (snRNP)-like protein